MHFLLFFLFLSLTSCGIKARPKPLPEPKFQLKRIGEFVYVIGNDLIVPGFRKGSGFWFARKEEAFCFEVKRVKGKSKKVCIPAAKKVYPHIRVSEYKERVKIISEEKRLFRIYRVLNSIPSPFPIKEFRKEATLNKYYAKYSVAITKVIKEPVESFPLYVYISPKPKPVPVPPYDIGYFKVDGKLVIYWFHRDFENLKGFNIYKNGKRLNKNPIKRNIFIDKYIPGTYEVRAVNKFGLESEGIKIYVP